MIFSKKGLTLLEILVAVTLFSVMMIFITQIVQMSLRHKKKISRDTQSQRQISNTLDIIDQDFNGVTTFFDFNKNLQRIYSLKKEGSSEDEKKLSFFLINPEFEFSGKEQEVEFATFSLVESVSGEMSHQLIKVRYFLQECGDLKTGEKTQCLLRSIISFEDDREIINKYALLKGVQSFKLFYYDKEQKEWLKEWENNPSDLSSTKWLPDFIRMDIEWKKERTFKESYTFTLSYPLLRNQKHQLQRVLAFIKEKDQEKNLKKSGYKKKARV